MDNLLKKHIFSINNLINFLNEYKGIIVNNGQKFTNTSVSENFYLANIDIENIQDSLVHILSISDIKENIKDINYNISKEIDEYNTVQSDIKDMMPMLIFYYMYKKGVIAQTAL